MEELVTKLAELQAELDGELKKADFVSANIDKHIVDAESRLVNLNKERDINRQPYIECAEELETKIDDIKAQIIDEWTGDKKTMVFDAGTLKFRTTKNLEIRDPLYLLGDMLRHLTAWEIADKYISGYNKTAVRQYLGVHPQPPDVAELIEKTSVKLEVRS